MIKRIHAHYRLRASEDQRNTIEKIYRVHEEYCPVARSLRGAIEIRTTYELVS